MGLSCYIISSIQKSSCLRFSIYQSTVRLPRKLLITPCNHTFVGASNETDATYHLNKNIKVNPTNTHIS